MKIAVFSGFYSPGNLNIIRELHEYLTQKGHEVLLIKNLENALPKALTSFDFFEPKPYLDDSFDFLISIGGDGNLLDSVTIIGESTVPVLGINTGRLGFLTSIAKELYRQGLDSLLEGQYTKIKRSVLSVMTTPPNSKIQKLNFALNEVCVTRKNKLSLLQIEAKINQEKLTTYWGDGLIISTPTGSTGYSLSVGGPIVSPDNSCWVLNPIAPHNISVRPLIVPDSNHIEIIVTGRGKNHLLSLDSRTISLEYGNQILVKKSEFPIHTIQLEGDSFFKTLRKKLYWGVDTRNRD
ncbi:MAG: NAD kinase [Flavobacteriaceae bacterium]|nr:NAD kinase [Flavobacteriaceae bacterium]MCY4268123.1 NAD kinase [Flavobacteriaceae bacterium]MCY4299846.1 NAD kinase [Flavobacteriaceae bacterium]